jgi:hypothetical protein
MIHKETDNISLRRVNILASYGLPLILFALAAVAIYPFYQYRIVSDDISYLKIAQRYLEGDYSRAINGYWSPLNIWLVFLAAKFSGMALLPVSYILNCLSFAGLLSLSITLCRKFIASSFELLCFGLVSAVFWAGNIPVTHFADALNSFLLLACLLVFMKKDFTVKPSLWIVYGILSAIAYYSKAYSFYIIPLTTAVLLFLRLRQEGSFTWKRWFIILLVIFGIMLAGIFPWLLLLQQKYGIWTVSTAGGVNTNWAIRGYIYFREDFKAVVPPVYPDSLSCWEDMWINHGIMLSPFQSAGNFIRQVIRAGVNVLQWVKVANEFSPFYIPVWLLSIMYLLRYRLRDQDTNRSAIIIAFLLFPAGYLLLSYGPRYLWFTVPLVMISGLIIAGRYVQPLMNTRFYRIFLLVYCCSWLPGVVAEMKSSFNEGKSDYQTAQLLTEMGIRGSFITHTYNDYQNHFRISYFSGNPYYMHFGDNWSTKELLEDANRFKVKYYYYFYNGTGGSYELKDALGHPYPEVTQGKIPGLKVFQLQ